MLIMLMKIFGVLEHIWHHDACPHLHSYNIFAYLKCSECAAVLALDDDHHVGVELAPDHAVYCQKQNSNLRAITSC